MFLGSFSPASGGQLIFCVILEQPQSNLPQASIRATDRHITRQVGLPLFPQVPTGGSFMRKFSIAVSILALISLAMVPLVTAQAPLPAQPQPITEKPVSPMMQEIKAAMAANEVAVKALQESLQTTADEAEALQILRAVDQQKQDTEIAILRIQERYARQNGDQETADQINLAVEKILNPDPVTPTAEAMAEREARRAGGAENE